MKYDVIEIGYEDFNYILTTKLGKYVVKIFNTDRDDNSCERLIKILCEPCGLTGCGSSEEG